MDLIDHLRVISNRIPKIKEHLKTEEATKTSLIMPFLQALGYDVFDPTEVVPEFTADVGTKKGEKVDYAVMKGGQPIMLIECKTANMALTPEHTSQLYRYYSVTTTRIGILTNGLLYQFFADLDEPNKMDAKPFLEFDMLDLNPGTVDAIKSFGRSLFDPEKIVNTAAEMRYMREIKRTFDEQLKEPDTELVKFFGARVFPGRMTQSNIDYLRRLIKTALNQVITDRIHARLRSALADEEAIASGHEPPSAIAAAAAAAPEEPKDKVSKVVTTQEELDAYALVQEIAGEVVDKKRVAIRDAVRYCSVLFDDSNRRPIVRLYFNNLANKKVAFIDQDKNEEMVAISEIADIRKHADKIKAIVSYYLANA
jgi:predicted type IV restriction endonuclease